MSSLRTEGDVMTKQGKDYLKQGDRIYLNKHPFEFWGIAPGGEVVEKNASIACNPVDYRIFKEKAEMEEYYQGKELIIDETGKEIELTVGENIVIVPSSGTEQREFLGVKEEEGILKLRLKSRRST